MKRPAVEEPGVMGGNAVMWLAQGVLRTRHGRGANTRKRLLCFESLESRQLMSASSEAMLPAFVDSSQQSALYATVQPSLAEADEVLAIDAVHLRVDGRLITVTSLAEPVRLSAGDMLEVVGIDYRLREGESVSGKIAFEAYLNEFVGKQLKTNYSDGLKGSSVQSGEIPEGISSHPGLKGSWKIEAGTESLSLAMVRYADNEATVEDRVKIRLQVGDPDFVLDTLEVKSNGNGLLVGQQVMIYGGWGNEGEGKYKNYAELDIYHVSDRTKLTWVGSISGVANAGEFVKGEFLQRHPEKPYSKRWIPDQPGQYILKFYADPEDRWSEPNERNNTAIIFVQVYDKPRPNEGHSAILSQRAIQERLEFDDVAGNRAIAAALAWRSPKQPNVSHASTKPIVPAARQYHLDRTPLIAILEGEISSNSRAVQAAVRQISTRAADAAFGEFSDENTSASSAVFGHDLVI